jgi:glutamate/tyrosine decarboxylase-like PLP-dependent enzyme
VADLWKAPKESKAIGTSTAGSSEAIMLGGLALKKRWQEARKAAGKDHYHPNIIVRPYSRLSDLPLKNASEVWVERASSA